MKHVLVQWSHGHLKTSILTEEYILDKTMLADPEKEGMIVFVKPGENSSLKNKVKAYLGRVKCVSDDKQFVEQEQRQLLTDTSKTCENTPPLPHKKLKRDRPDELGNTATHVNAKRPATEVARQAENQNNGMHASSVAIDENKPSKEKEELSRLSSTIRTLQGRIRKLENDLASEKATVKELLKTNLVLQNNLPELLLNALQSSSLIHKLQTFTCACTSQANSVATGIRQASPQPLDNGKMVCEKEEPAWTEEQPIPTVYTEPLRNEEKAEEDDKNQISSITSPTDSLSCLVDPIPMSRIANATNYKRQTSALLCALFERSVLEVSSVTGKSKAGRPALDKKIVELIIDYVQKSFPTTTDKEIKATMAQKCKDLRKSAERRKRLVKTVE